MASSVAAFRPRMSETLLLPSSLQLLLPVGCGRRALAKRGACQRARSRAGADYFGGPSDEGAERRGGSRAGLGRRQRGAGGRQDRHERRRSSLSVSDQSDGAPNPSFARQRFTIAWADAEHPGRPSSRCGRHRAGRGGPDPGTVTPAGIGRAWRRADGIAPCSAWRTDANVASVPARHSRTRPHTSGPKWRISRRR